jgi:hypothetical protein
MSIYCEHVYKYIHANPCPECGKETHDINWALIAEMHKDWIDNDNSQGK